MKKKNRKRGRKPKGAKGRTIVIAIKVSLEELTAFKKLALKEEMHLGPWLLAPRRKEILK